MSARACGCDPELKTPSLHHPAMAYYACENFPACDHGRSINTSQQSRGWYLIMLPPRRGSDDVERFLTVHEHPPQGEPRVFWTILEHAAFRFPTAEAAQVAQNVGKVGGPDGIGDAWIIYRSF